MTRQRNHDTAMCGTCLQAFPANDASGSAALLAMHLAQGCPKERPPSFKTTFIEVRLPDAPVAEEDDLLW